MALIALVNRVLPDPMLLHIVSSFHGDFRVEVKVLSLKRYWLAQNQELVRQHREKKEDTLVLCMHRVRWFFHEERKAYWEDAADRAPAIPLPDIDRDEQEVAMKAAQAALRVWYTHGHNHANTIIPQMQIDSNWKEVAAIPGWQTQIGVRNGFVMLTTLVHGRLKPTILVLDIEQSPTGRLSYRQLHQQIRADLCLESKHSLRLCSFRPWYRYMQASFPIPEHRALPATDAQCTQLLGTTLLYWSYVHLMDGDTASRAKINLQWGDEVD